MTFSEEVWDGAQEGGAGQTDVNDLGDPQHGLGAPGVFNTAGSLHMCKLL